MGDAPPCALKIGPINCFCLWNGVPLENTRREYCNFNIGAALENKQIQSPETLTAREGTPRTSSAASRAIQSERSAAVALGSSGGGSTLAPSPVTLATVAEVTSASVGDGARSSRGSKEVRNVNQVDHPLTAAVRLQSGNAPSLDRELSFVDGASMSQGINAGAHDRLRRIVTQHRFAAQCAEWQVHENSLRIDGLEFGARVVDGMSQWFRCAEFRGCDAVKGFAAFLEVDLVGSFSEAVLAAEPLGVHTAKRDAIWRVVGDSSSSNGRSGVKQEETVWSYFALDALDEPLGALVVFAHTPLEHRFPGASGAMSQQKRGDAMDFDCVIHCIEPLRPEKGEPASRGGFRLRQTGVSKLAVAATSPATPVAAHVDMPRQEAFHARLSKFISFAKQLDERMRMSPRTDLYARVRRHIQRLSPVAFEQVQDDAANVQVRMQSIEYDAENTGAM
eukprot:TRINITY_DN12095_c0_g4_i1.p1 TRINITY_DN12095_c0_g4~~TRINITY_DN12095_c0_g4_i1.p1  ORF type:complete len:449 (-),score=66.90 TRINITY_DN12095_c0_g4_i1:9-1355(-)